MGHTRDELAVPQHGTVNSPAATEVGIEGMNCESCVRRVSAAIQALPGVAEVTVSLESRRATVRWRDPGQINQEAVLQAIRESGYEPRPGAARSELSVTGMTCNNCARHVMGALQRVPGVEDAEVQLEKGHASIRWKSSFPPNDEALIAAVKGAGYNATVDSAHVHDAESKDTFSPLSGWKFNVVVGSIVTVLLMTAEWVFRLGMERWYQWAAFLLVLPVQVLCGARFYRGAWNQLKRAQSNMDTLVVLGSTTAFAYSAWGLFAGWMGHLFFMESAAIITLISVGHWIEMKVSARAASSLRALLNLAPQTARFLDPGGAEVQVAVAKLHVGDRIVIKPGDRVAIDAEVLEGVSTVDESMLTGESVPVEKRQRSKLYGGTLNLQGWLLARVTATGESTALAQIIAVVQRAQNSRAEIQKLGDRVSSIFVPIVVVIALGTGLWWGLAPASALQVSTWIEPFLWPAHHPTGSLATAIYHAAAVLIIACPCAMGLATPVAIMAGTNVAAERGILIRDGIALEKTGRLSSIVFDKTGTLTEGKLAVVAAQDSLTPDLHEIGLHKIAASLAKPSLHPLSQALSAGSHATLPISDWHEVRGSGVQAKLQGESASLSNRVLSLGSLAWLRQLGVDLTSRQEFIQGWSAKGATIVGLAADQQLLGLFALRDAIKAGAAEVIAQLREQRKTVYLITGDNQATALAIAKASGLDEANVFAEVRPEAKAEIVRNLQERGERCAFIGDGINDAPALEQADLGIAVSRASDVAREAADIILLKSDIRAVPEALDLAHATLRVIKQNLFWAFFYNAAGVPLAALGFMSPILSAAAMGLSDLIVIGNALRLRRWRRE